jgi:hypothetical protein
MEPRRRSFLAVAAAVPAPIVVSMLLAHCGDQDLSARDGGHESDATVEAGAGGDAAEDQSAATCGASGSICLSDAGVPVCVADAGWQCAVDTTCSSATTVRGKVFDPAGLNPLANVVVFVPNDGSRLPAMSPGAPTCESTVSIGDFVTFAITDASGSFVLTGVPVGNGVPITVQTGKWRRTVEMSISKACTTTQIPDGTLHLPGRRSDGDMPQMALLTGGADNLACFLVSVGIDPSEFTAPQGGGRVAVYQGVGGADLSNGTPGDCTGSACPLWSTTAALDAYDVLLLGCEGGENLQTKPASAVQAMHDWLTGGGKLFGVHYQNVWFANGPADFQGVADWVDDPEAGATGPFQIALTSPQGLSSPQGILFRQWVTAEGIVDAGGGLPLRPQDVATSVSGVNGRTAVRWIYDESTFAGNVKAFSVGLPIVPGDGGESAPAPGSCSKAVLTDIHPGGTAPQSPIPSSCVGLSQTPEEKVLEYLFFDSFTIASRGCDPCPPPQPPPPPAMDGG